MSGKTLMGRLWSMPHMRWLSGDVENIYVVSPGERLTPGQFFAEIPEPKPKVPKVH